MDEAEILEEIIERQDKEIATLKAGLVAVSELIDNSKGVAGLNLNDDIVYWSEIRKGAQYEEWLIEFDEALDLI